MSSNRNLRTAGTLVVLCVAAAVSTTELLLIHRKHGILAGGFSQTRALVDAPDLLFFAVSYGISQLLLTLAVWWCAVRVGRDRPGWVAPAAFAMVMGGGFVGALIAKYQLYSYFSDTVSFALLKQLAGGSAVDAFLFASSELATPVLLAGCAGVLLWLVLRLLPSKDSLINERCRPR